jgi:hypothetical protein
MDKWCERSSRCSGLHVRKCIMVKHTHTYTHTHVIKQMYTHVPHMHKTHMPCAMCQGKCDGSCEAGLLVGSCRCEEVHWRWRTNSTNNCYNNISAALVAFVAFVFSDLCPPLISQWSNWHCASNSCSNRHILSISTCLHLPTHLYLSLPISQLPAVA